MIAIFNEKRIEEILKPHANAYIKLYYIKYLIVLKKA
jgi:hypothetical protein